MAVIKAINSKSSINKIINYVSDKNKTDENLMIGKDCSSDPQQAIEDMKMTKEIYDKTEGRQYKHFVQSFSPEDKITSEKANEIGREWAEKNFKGYEVFIATHTDKEHIHNHFVINTVNFETGEKYRQSRADLNRYKEISNKICEREGLMKTPSDSKEITSFNNKKYKAIEQSFEGNKESYLVETGKAVEKNISISKSKEEFIKNMQKEGYKVKWIDTRKSITYEDKEGHKVRSENLAKTFKEEGFKKDEILKQFEKNNNPKSKEEDIEKLNNEKKEIEKQERELRTVIGKNLSKLENEIKHRENIKGLKESVEKENVKKSKLGLFKRSEKKNCDDRINKYLSQIGKIENLLLSSGQVSEIKQSIEEDRIKLDEVSEKIRKYNDEIQKHEELIKKEKEKENKKTQKQEKGEKKNQRIPSNFREKDKTENKKTKGNTSYSRDR